MDWKDVKELVSKAAPLIGNAIGGPAGGMVAGWIASELKEDVDQTDPMALVQAIKSDPDALFKIKDLESKHKEELQRIGLEMFRAEVSDKNSARARETAFVQATGGRDILVAVLAVSIVYGFFGVLAALMWANMADVSEFKKGVLNILLGALAREVAAVTGYYFGSSKGSNDKNKFANLK